MSWRLGAYYGAIFAAVGIHIPYWPLWLADRGMSPSEIGILFAAAYLIKLVASPGVGHWVDHRGDRRRPMIWLATASGLLWLAFPLAHDFPSILAMTVIAVFPFTGLMPVGDSLAMMAVRSHGLDYGRVRLWGSLAFILAATLLGRGLGWVGVSALPWLLSATLLLTALACAGLPDLKIPPTHDRPPPLSPVLRNPAFLLFLGVTALGQAAHTVYYAFATLHWRSSGLSDTAIGLLWSEGVVAEIVLFAFSGRVVAVAGPVRLLLLAALGGVLRWSVLGITTDLVWVALVQVLHAATFGCTHLGAMHFIQQAVPPSLSARAQGLYAAVAVGLAPGLMTPVSGALFERWGGFAFLSMAVLSALAALLCLRLMQGADRPEVRAD